ncbi:MAG: peptidylprolyl isomerase [Planctomycetes bacterium]|nr:peptidylprolyl isomerase [Planctomycetota bacterium]
MNEFAAAVPRLEKAEKLKGSLPPALEAEIEETLESAKAAAGPWEEELERRAREREADDLPRVRLKTDKGDIVVELFENEAPNAVANFVDLCSKDFYAGTTFHRIEFGRRVIGGDPLSKDKNPDNDGTGGPGYTFRDEFEGAYRRHFGGSLAMWSHGRDSNGSQFFIDVKPLPELDGKQVVFGRVIEGMAVVARLRAGDKIVGAEILRKRAHAYRPVIE